MLYIIHLHTIAFATTRACIHTHKPTHTHTRTHTVAHKKQHTFFHTKTNTRNTEGSSSPRSVFLILIVFCCCVFDLIFTTVGFFFSFFFLFFEPRWVSVWPEGSLPLFGYSQIHKNEKQAQTEKLKTKTREKTKRGTKEVDTNHATEHPFQIRLYSPSAKVMRFGVEPDLKNRALARFERTSSESTSPTFLLPPLLAEVFATGVAKDDGASAIR